VLNVTVQLFDGRTPMEKPRTDSNRAPDMGYSGVTSGFRREVDELRSAGLWRREVVNSYRRCGTTLTLEDGTDR
jgi:hypothetical protein